MSSKSQINWSNIDEIVESLIEKYDEMKSESFISEINPTDFNKKCIAPWKHFKIDKISELVI